MLEIVYCIVCIEMQNKTELKIMILISKTKLENQELPSSANCSSLYYILYLYESYHKSVSFTL